MIITEQEFSTFFDGIEFRDIVIPSTGETSQMPLISRNNTAMTAVYTASRSKVMDILPIRDFVPALLPEDRTLFTMTAIEYANRNIPPYNEIIVAIPVNVGKSAAAPTVDDLLKPNLGGAVLYIRHLIVDTRLAEIIGNEILGYNKFISSIEFTETPESRTCVVTEAGQEMIRFTVYPDRGQAGIVYERDNNTVATYKNGKINLLTYPLAFNRSEKQPKKAMLEFGPHPLGMMLASLDLSKQPIVIRFSTDWRLISDEKNLKVFEP